MKKYTMQFSMARLQADGRPCPVRGIHSQFEIVQVGACSRKEAEETGCDIVRARRPKHIWLIDGGAEEMKDRQMGIRIG